MKYNKILMRFFRCGSICLICSMLFGCDTERSEYALDVDWVYQNQSSYVLEIKGFTGFHSQIDGDFTLQPGGEHTIQYRGDGPETPDPAYIKTPYSLADWSTCTIIVDNAVTYDIEEDRGLRNQNNYGFEKLGNRYFRFTYTFTDENIKELTQ